MCYGCYQLFLMMWSISELEIYFREKGHKFDNNLYSNIGKYTVVYVSMVTSIFMHANEHKSQKVSPE